MNNVERFNNLMAFKPVDRLPFMEWAIWWDKTLDRWYKEGLPADLKDPNDIRLYFGLDGYRQMWINPMTDACPEAEFGQPIVHNEQQYDMLKALMYPEKPFDTEELKSWAIEHQNSESVVWYEISGYFWHPRVLLGIENHMLAFYDQPDLMHKMNRDLMEFNIRVVDEVCSICLPDFVVFAEDMSYNHGPMLSRQQFDEFLVPYYLKTIEKLKQHNVLVIADTDGNVTELIPWLKSVGFDGILPLERMAGVDVAQIRRDYPDFRMIGAFDKTVIHLGEEAMRQEFARLLPVMKQGGFIPSVDHQTPPGVSLEQYKSYVSLLKEYCERAVQ